LNALLTGNSLVNERLKKLYHFEDGFFVVFLFIIHNSLKTFSIISLVLLSFLMKSQIAWAQFSYDDTTSENSRIEKTPEINKFRFLKIDRDTISLGLNDILVCDSFCAQGMPSTYDALHSFNYRRMDRFGGYLNVKVNKGLEQVRAKGFDSDVKKLYIQIDPVTLKVYWFAILGPSTDGRSYVRIDSRGSAGGGISAVEKQLPNMHKLYPDMKAIKLMEFNENVKVCYDWNGNQLCDFKGTVNIRQHFYKYAANGAAIVTPIQDKPIIVSDSTQTMKMDSVVVITPPVKPIVKASPKPKYKNYKVKDGDTLSEIAEKHHIGLSKLKKFNNLRSDKIQIGQTLKIPK
jgi:LysM repeat protein